MLRSWDHRRQGERNEVSSQLRNKLREDREPVCREEGQQRTFGRDALKRISCDQERVAHGNGNVVFQCLTRYQAMKRRIWIDFAYIVHYNIIGRDAISSHEEESLVIHLVESSNLSFCDLGKSLNGG